MLALVGGALPVNSQQVVDGNGAWIRTTDSEYKILNRLANDLHAERGRTYSDVFGEVRLVSERKICPSCEDVILQFQKMFPNIKVSVINGTKY